MEGTRLFPEGIWIFYIIFDIQPTSITKCLFISTMLLMQVSFKITTLIIYFSIQSYFVYVNCMYYLHVHCTTRIQFNGLVDVSLEQ